MMDNFREEVVVRRKNGLYNLLYMLSWAVLVLSVIMAMIALQGFLMMVMSGSFDLINLAVLVVFGGLAFLIWRNKDQLRAEYEYTFTNGELDVAKVLNNQKRKYLTCLNMKNLEAAGAVNTPAFQRYLSMKDVKKHNWFLNREAKLYYYFFTKNQVRHLMVVELSDEMVELTKKPNYMNYGVWQG